MASLTTVYMISVLLSSLAGMGAAFVGNRIYPIKGGAEVAPAEVKEATEAADKATGLAADKAAKLAAAESYQIKKAQEDEPPTEEAKVEEEPKPTEEAKVEEEPKPTEEAKVEQQPESDKLTKAIMDGFGMDAEFAKNVVSFIKTPVRSWREIASTQSELKQKFMKTLTHPNLNKCPEALKNICKIVAVKYSNMKDFIEEKDYTPFEDETADALNVLSSNPSP